MADLELAPRTAIVATGAEAQVGTTAADEVSDDAVTRAVEQAAVVQVGAAGDDEQDCGGLPWLLEQGGLGQGYDGVVGGEKTAEGIDALAD